MMTRFHRCNLWILCIFTVKYLCDARKLPYPDIKSLLILNDTIHIANNNISRKLFLEFKGEHLNSEFGLKITENDVQCDDSDYEVNIIRTEEDIAKFVVILPVNVSTDLYFCVKENDLTNAVNFGEEVVKWRHVGNNIFIKSDSRTKNESSKQYFYPDSHNPKGVRRKRRTPPVDPPPESKSTVTTPLRIRGVRVEHSNKEPQVGDDGVPSLLAGSTSKIRIFGDGFTEDTVVVLTQKKNEYGGQCQLPSSDIFRVEPGSIQDGTAVVSITLPEVMNYENPFFFCAKYSDTEDILAKVDDAKPFVHQGSDTWIQLRHYKLAIPIWASIIIIIVCLSFSALFSGLNLGLMALDRTELKILCNTGNESERKHARAIQPVRDHGNYLLCSILLGNVLVNSIFTILLDSLTSGFIAVIFSTLAIVMFGEISPQAICSRYGLAVGAKTIYITKAVMIITAPLSYPISKILDLILGEELGNVYNRERLKELLKVTTDITDLDRDEVNIVTGALELRKKTVADIMTKIDDVFMLELESTLDFETVSEIMKTGFSRIPVYEGDRQNIITVLYIKDLAFVDPDDNTPLKTLCQFYQNPCNFVFEDLTLDIMFKEFKEGNKGHMAFVHRVNSEGEGDPFYEVIGLVTLEDVIEELIQAEIMDETDVFTDNRSKRRRNAERAKQDFSIFAERRENQYIHISPQLTLATYQYLSASVDLFKPDIISEVTLKRLLKQDIFMHIKKNKDKKDQNCYIYQQGKPVDYFVLILEGRVEVTVGKENLVFEGGPFTFFGLQALMQNVGVGSRPPSQVFNTDLAVTDNVKGRQKPPSTGVSPVDQVESPVAPTNMGSLQSLNMDAMIKYTFLPDYSVRAVTDVLYMKVRRSLYLAAKRATLMERSQKDSTGGQEQFDAEMEKLLCSLDDEDVRRMSPNKTSDRDIRHDSALIHSLSHGSQTSPRLQSPASFSPRDSSNVNGLLKLSSRSEEQGEPCEGATLLEQHTSEDNT